MQLWSPKCKLSSPKFRPLSLRIRMDNRPIMGTVSDADAVVDVDAAPLGEPNTDADDHQLRTLQSADGPTETVLRGKNNAHILLMETGRIQPLRT